MEHINTSRIPKSEGNVMAAMLYSTITEFFADPKHQQEFEKWQQERKRSRKVIPMKK